MHDLDDAPTTLAVQHYLDVLGDAGDGSRAGPVVRDLLDRSADRLHLLCASLLHRHYRRLTLGPTNLRPEEMLSGVTLRLLKALRKIKPATVRQFFALANQHMRWELNDVARRLDEAATVVELRDSVAAGDPPPAPAAGPKLRRILDAIADLPDAEREAFSLVRLQGMTQPEAVRVIGCSERTLQRRLGRSLVLLTARLGDLRDAPPHATVAD